MTRAPRPVDERPLRHDVVTALQSSLLRITTRADARLAMSNHTDANDAWHQRN